MNQYLCQFIGSIAHGSATYGRGIGEIHLDNVQCTGSESSLLACTYASIDNCFHGEDAGVQCLGQGSEKERIFEEKFNIY